MPIKTGKQYINSLRDGRRLYIDGKVVTDVTDYPPLQGVIGTIAALHDDQHDPALRDLLVYKSPTTGEPVSTTYLEARTAPGVHRAGRLLPPARQAHLRPDGTVDRLHVGLPGRPGGRTARVGQDRGGRPRPGHGRALPRERLRGHPCADRSAVRPLDPRCALAGGPGRRARGRGRRRQRLPHALDLGAGRQRVLRRPLLSAQGRRGEVRAGLRGADGCTRPLDPLPRELPSRAERVRPAAQQPFRRRRRHPDVRPRAGAARAHDHRRRPRGLQRHAVVAAGLHADPGHHPLDHEAALPGRHGDGDRARQRPGQAAALPGRHRRADSPGERRRGHPRRRDRGGHPARRSFRQAARPGSRATASPSPR